MQSQSSMFQASFVYTDEILSDFEQLYHLKGSLSPVARSSAGCWVWLVPSTLAFSCTATGSKSPRLAISSSVP